VLHWSFGPTMSPTSFDGDVFDARAEPSDARRRFSKSSMLLASSDYLAWRRGLRSNNQEGLDSDPTTESDTSGRWTPAAHRCGISDHARSSQRPLGNPDMLITPDIGRAPSAVA